MQVRDLIAQLQAFEPTAKVVVAIVKGDDTDFLDVAEVRRENLPRRGNCLAIEPFAE